VLKTPSWGLDLSPRGWTRRTSRSARSSQVIRRTSSPGWSEERASSTDGSKYSQAEGAPSSGWRGVVEASVSGETTRPMRRTSKHGGSRSSNERLSRLQPSDSGLGQHRVAVEGRDRRAGHPPRTPGPLPCPRSIWSQSDVRHAHPVSISILCHADRMCRRQPAISCGVY
jgi:hypothetical protein